MELELLAFDLYKIGVDLELKEEEEKVHSLYADGEKVFVYNQATGKSEMLIEVDEDFDLENNETYLHILGFFLELMEPDSDGNINIINEFHTYLQAITLAALMVKEDYTKSKRKGFIEMSFLGGGFGLSNAFVDDLPEEELVEEYFLGLMAAQVFDDEDYCRVHRTLFMDEDTIHLYRPEVEMGPKEDLEDQKPRILH